jgi:hypothetical protein
VLLFQRGGGCPSSSALILRPSSPPSSPASRRRVLLVSADPIYPRIVTVIELRDITLDSGARARSGTPTWVVCALLDAEAGDIKRAGRNRWRRPSAPRRPQMRSESCKESGNGGQHNWPQTMGCRVDHRIPGLAPATTPIGVRLGNRTMTTQSGPAGRC